MHPNEGLLRDLDEAQQSGDVARFGEFFAEDVIVHIAGNSSLAGTIRGRDQLFETYKRFSERVEYTFEPHAYLADDEHGVSMQKSHYSRGDQSLDSNDMFVCHFRDGKISEAWILSEDNEAVDALIG